MEFLKRFNKELEIGKHSRFMASDLGWDDDLEDDDFDDEDDDFDDFDDDDEFDDFDDFDDEEDL